MRIIFIGKNSQDTEQSICRPNNIENPVCIFKLKRKGPSYVSMNYSNIHIWPACPQVTHCNYSPVLKFMRIESFPASMKGKEVKFTQEKIIRCTKYEVHVWPINSQFPVIAFFYGMA